MGSSIINEAEVFDYIDGFEGSVEEQAIEAFDYAGTEFMKHARVNASFTNRTKNLRNSIGYSTVIKGKEVHDRFGGEGGNSDWKKDVKEAKTMLLKKVKGIGLIGLAGMSYGVYVENMKGKSVISQSIPETEKLLNRLFDEI